MSKSHEKKSKKDRRPNVPATTLLHPRLRAFLGSETPLQREQRMIFADLDKIGQGIKPDAFLQAILIAHVEAPQPIRDQMEDLIPLWLRERGYLETLETMVARETLSVEQEQQALAWLEAAGKDVSYLVARTEQDQFFRAVVAGNEMQAGLIILYYTNRQQTRVRGFNFLIDYNPPWDGAVKDIIYYGQRVPNAAVAQYIEPWHGEMEGVGSVTELDAVEAKRQLLVALNCNRATNIRLPADLIAVREPFLRSMLSLPDGPETPAFSVEDFDFLSTHGQKPEILSRQEQRFGYRTRMPDGQEVLIMRDPDME